MPLEFATACACGQFVKNVAFAPWLPGTLNNGTESPACGQKLGPKIELTRIAGLVEVAVVQLAPAVVGGVAGGEREPDAAAPSEASNAACWGLFPCWSVSPQSPKTANE